MELAACEKPFSNTLQRVKADIRNSLRCLLLRAIEAGNLPASSLCVAQPYQPLQQQPDHIV